MSAAVAGAIDPGWLELREDADAEARAAGLLDPLRAHLAGRAARPLVVRDLGCGTGSMARWLAGRLPGPQHWVLYDHDPALLALAAARLPARTADGGAVTAEAHRRDITRLRAADLAGTSLVTASALLDLLTGPEVAGLAEACAGAGVPALLVLSVVGRVELAPADPLDGAIAEAFNAHQRRSRGAPVPVTLPRTTARKLGPDAVDAAAEAFARAGMAVHRRPSPWRLGPARAALTAEWLRGWVRYAVEQRPALAAPAGPYLRRRLRQCAAGELRAVVGHEDLLALPAGG
ncbi:trans-aconitate methyltransferase [Actinomadura sp. NBRC 104425]|uniref:methyltransferase domain-containing protein n=1 Tax=Actinomadura sp. NBRC 104425 TaxID=3032204 RepID=UPI0024A14CC3|nr:methyltransferase domain-containing protein [Actinomadura sp. NBRC 104425]GLZ12069.1 trans-aconitate methyltransferase [Actinomadura sp. NBRC 104425]